MSPRLLYLLRAPRVQPTPRSELRITNALHQLREHSGRDASVPIPGLRT